MTRPLAVGVQLPEVERQVTWPEMRDMALAAESAGFDSIWLGDHLLYRSPDGVKGPWEAWSMLAALAAVTERLQLGPLVAATSFHNPAMLAKKAAAVNEISEGRLILGLGAGWNETEYNAFGFPYDHRASRFEEAFTIIRKLLREGEIDFEGDYYQLRECVLEPPSAYDAPPLMIGSNGPRVLASTLAHVDLWNTWHAWYGNGLPGLIKEMNDVDDICRSVGRAPGQVAKTAAMLVGAAGSTGRSHGSPGRPTSDAIVEPAEELAERLAAYAAAGIDHVQLVLDPITVESVESMGTMLKLLDGR